MAKKSSVEIIWDQAAVHLVIGGISEEAAERAVLKIIERAERGIAALGRVKSGQMISGFVYEKRGTPLSPTVFVYNKAPYTIYQERGTRGSRAKTGALRFSIGNKIVFAKSTGPVPAGNFISGAVGSINLSDFAP